MSPAQKAINQHITLTLYFFRDTVSLILRDATSRLLFESARDLEGNGFRFGRGLRVC